MNSIMRGEEERAALLLLLPVVSSLMQTICQHRELTSNEICAVDNLKTAKRKNCQANLFDTHTFVFPTVHPFDLNNIRNTNPQHQTIK